MSDLFDSLFDVVACVGLFFGDYLREEEEEESDKISSLKEVNIKESTYISRKRNLIFEYDDES